MLSCAQAHPVQASLPSYRAHSALVSEGTPCHRRAAERRAWSLVARGKARREWRSAAQREVHGGRDKMDYREEAENSLVCAIAKSDRCSATVKDSHGETSSL